MREEGISLRGPSLEYVCSQAEKKKKKKRKKGRKTEMVVVCVICPCILYVITTSGTGWDGAVLVSFQNMEPLPFSAGIHDPSQTPRCPTELKLEKKNKRKTPTKSHVQYSNCPYQPLPSGRILGTHHLWLLRAIEQEQNCHQHLPGPRDYQRRRRAQPPEDKRTRQRAQEQRSQKPNPPIP